MVFGHQPYKKAKPASGKVFRLPVFRPAPYSTSDDFLSLLPQKKRRQTLTAALQRLLRNTKGADT